MTRMLQVTVTVAALAATLAWAAVASAAKLPRLATLEPLSGKSTFTGCPFEVPPPFHDRNWKTEDTAVEPRIAVDPNDDRRMAAGWMQDFSSSIVVASTTDGGRTWRLSNPPGISKCTGGEGTAFDPGLAYGADGTLYLSGMIHLRVAPGRTTPDDAIGVSRSEDGGATWSNPAIVQPRDGFNDYPTIAADPEVPGRVYVTWTKLTEPLGGNAVAGYLAVSEDSGRTWSGPRVLYSAERVFHNWSGQLVAAPGGRLAYVVDVSDQQNFLPLAPRVDNRILALTSEDRGRTWSEPAVVATKPPASAPEDPDSGDSIRPGAFQAAAGPDRRIWVTFATYAEDAQRLWLAHSDGAGWSAPKEIVSRSPGTVVLPSVAAGPAGVAVAWYDTRRDARGDGRWDADVVMAVSTDGGASFREVHVAGPMDLRGGYADARAFADSRPVRFLGDYVGLAPRRRGFAAALPLTRPLARVGESQLFFAGVRLSSERKRAARRRGKARCRRSSARRGRRGAPSPRKCPRRGADRRRR